MREAFLPHSGEALASRQAFVSLSSCEHDCLIEFLKSLQLAPSQTTGLFVDKNGRPTLQPRGPKLDPSFSFAPGTPIWRSKC